MLLQKQAAAPECEAGQAVPAGEKNRAAARTLQPGQPLCPTAQLASKAKHGNEGSSSAKMKRREGAEQKGSLVLLGEALSEELVRIFKNSSYRALGPVLALGKEQKESAGLCGPGGQSWSEGE